MAEEKAMGQVALERNRAVCDAVVEAREQGGCIYYSTDAFLGPHGIHVMRFAGPWVKRAFDDTAYALKAFVEAEALKT